jgi:hypothetical protein
MCDYFAYTKPTHVDPPSQCSSHIVAGASLYKGLLTHKTSEATPILRTASLMTAFDIATGDKTRAPSVSCECQRKNSGWALLHPYATPAH